jgi:hypothetical protein
MPDRLDAALRQLAEEVVFPPTPPVAASVRERLVANTGPPPPRRRPWGRSVAFAIGLSLVVVATVLALSLVLPGLRIVPVASVPPGPTDELGEDLRLGQPIDAADARFIIGEAGSAVSAYTLDAGTVTSLVLAAGEGLPEIADTGIGLLVQRIEGDLETAMVEKLVDEVGATVTPVTIGDADGFWIEGPPHLVRYLTPSGAVRTEMTRLVGDTLVWQRDGILYRMESPLGLEASRRLAASVRER